MALRFPNHPYYIPIIKWQSWEQRALLQTRGDVKPYVRPCIEVRHSNQHSSLVGNFQTAWGAPAFCKVVVASAVFLSCYFHCRLLPLWVECDGADRLPISRCT